MQYNVVRGEMKIRILLVINIVTIIVCMILTVLYFISNPGGFYMKSDGFLPSVEYASQMAYYKSYGTSTNYTSGFEIKITTTDRSVEVCTSGNSGIDKDIVEGNLDKLSKKVFTSDELQNMTTITIDDYTYTISDGMINEVISNNSYAYVGQEEYIGLSIDSFANKTYYYSELNPTLYYSAAYINEVVYSIYYDVNGFFYVDYLDNGSANIKMAEDVEDANLSESISIILPYDIEDTCTRVEPNSTYIIDSTGGRYEE